MSQHDGRRRRLAGLLGVALGALIAMTLPAVVAAHAELERSTPADGANVPSPFDGPITLAFSEALMDGSKADLLGPDGATVASATVDGPGAAMTIALDAPLAAGTYEVRWVSVAADTDLKRGTFSFTVEAAPVTPSPPASPAASAPVATPTASIQASAPASIAPSASPSPAPVDSGAASSGGEVLIPIVAALLVVGVGAVYLLGRRKRPTPS